MSQCLNTKISTTNRHVLGVIQIMIGSFNVLMWYFVMLLYVGQTPGVFGVYHPVTYKTGCALWGVLFILAGIFIIRAEKHATHYMVTCAFSMSILSVIAAMTALILTIIELSTFRTVSYRNYGKAKLGREVSRVLLIFYLLEIFTAFIYSLFTGMGLNQRHTGSTTSEEHVESSL